MSVTFEQVINKFLEGAHEQEVGSVSTTGTLRIKGEQLVHYATPISERCNDKILVNITRYSLATGKLQKKLKMAVPTDKYVQVRGVQEGYKGTLVDLLLPDTAKETKADE